MTLQCDYSHVNIFFFVVDLEVKTVIVPDELSCLEGVGWIFVVRVLTFKLLAYLVPFRVYCFAVILVLLHLILLAFLWCHLKCFLKHIWIDLLQNSLKSNQRFLEDFVPVVLGKVDNYWYEHWEGLVFVGL